MIRKIALLLVLTVSVGSAHVLACELACVPHRADTTSHCHEDAAVGTKVITASGAQCSHDGRDPVLTTPKASPLQQLGAVAHELGGRAERNTLSTAASSIELPAGARSLSRSPINRILRI